MSDGGREQNRFQCGNVAFLLLLIESGTCNTSTYPLIFSNYLSNTLNSELKANRYFFKNVVSII